MTQRPNSQISPLLRIEADLAPFAQIRGPRIASNERGQPRSTPNTCRFCGQSQ